MSLSFADLFGNTLVDKDGKQHQVSELEGKTVGIYFSAHWCPPCRAFSPVLARTTAEAKEAGVPWEVVFVSADQTEGDMQHYMTDVNMPFLAIPFDAAQRQAIGARFGVRGIPSLLILKNGEITEFRGVDSVRSRGIDAIRTFSA